MTETPSETPSTPPVSGSPVARIRAWFAVPQGTRFLEILGFSLGSGMDLKAAIEVARGYMESLEDHHRVNMLEAAIERGENLVEALLEAGLVGIDQLGELKLAEQSGFLAQTLAKMGARKGPSLWFKPIDISGKVLVGFYLVFLAGGLAWVFMEMF